MHRNGWGWQTIVALILFWLTSAPAHATHIVGGQLGMQRVSTGQYDISLTLYFDAINGSSGARDPTVLVGIFERGTQTQLDTIRLPRISTQPVAYSQPSCAQPSVLETEEIQYRLRVSLNPAHYSSPKGYYLVWERCCRNNIITNIVAPDAAGTAFFLAFPALTTPGGVAVSNSSAAGFRPTGDYACVDKLFNADFGGTDADGDQLRYALVTPLNGHGSSSEPIPAPQSGPYPRITWLPGYDSLNAIPGDPALAIDSLTGELSLKASVPGLYVFAVRCQERRAGQLIGEVWREFQLRVFNCPPNQAGNLNLAVPTASGGTRPYVPGDTLLLPAPVAGQERCLNLLASDSDLTDVLTLQLLAAPGTPTVGLPSLSPSSGMVVRGDTLLGRICFPDCFGTDGQVRTYLLVMNDGACPIPHRDTVALTVRAPIQPDNPPALTTTAAPAGYDVQIGDTVVFEFTGRDPDVASTVSVRLANLNTGPIAGYAITCPARAGINTATTQLRWVLGCEVLPGDYELRLATTGADACGRELSTDSVVHVRVLPLPDTATYVLLETDSTGYRVQDGDSVSFTFTGIDVDSGTTVVVRATNLNTGRLAGLPIVCPTSTGTNRATTRLRWLITCEVDTGRYEIALQTRATACGQLAVIDTTVVVQVVAPPDILPTLAVRPDSAQFTVRGGQTLTFDFTGRDPDPDTRVLVRATNLTVAPLQGQPIECPERVGDNEATTTLRWPITCDLPPGDYALRLQTVSEFCSRVRTADSVVWVRVLPPDSTRVLPPNIFTPNADGRNDLFQPAAGVVAGCGQEFRRVRLFNRWGGQVWTSTDQLATWNGADAGEGMYYYLLEYTDRTYKGWVELIR